MKILVTGANGYLGSGIVKHVLDNGNEVVAADFKVDHIDPRAELVECNLFDIDNPYEYFGNPDVLLHLAWRDGFVHYSDAHIEDLPKHYKLIRLFSESDVKKIAVMGTMHEIGFFEGAIKEDTPCHPTTPYGISKFCSDIKRMRPFGPENPKPIFCTRQVYDYGTSKVVGREQEHIKLELVDNTSSRIFNGIAFGQSSQARYIKTKQSFDIAYTIEENAYRKGEVQLQIIDIRPRPAKQE